MALAALYLCNGLRGSAPAQSRPLVILPPGTDSKPCFTQAEGQGLPPGRIGAAWNWRHHILHHAGRMRSHPPWRLARIIHSLDLSPAFGILTITLIPASRQVGARTTFA